jgi:hypothetical protein
MNLGIRTRFRQHTRGFRFPKAKSGGTEANLHRVSQGSKTQDFYDLAFEKTKFVEALDDSRRSADLTDPGMLAALECTQGSHGETTRT